jgi:hypothetical protein
MLALTLVHLAMLPVTFKIEAYLGVITILAAGMALASTIVLFMSDTAAVWVFALSQGLLNVAGYLFTRLVGMPLAEQYSLHRWSHPPALTVALLGTAVAGLACWTLHRRRGLPSVPTPVTSARQRELLLRSAGDDELLPRPDPASPRKVSSNSSGRALRATPRRFVIFPCRVRGRYPRRSPAGSVAHHLDR